MTSAQRDAAIARFESNLDHCMDESDGKKSVAILASEVGAEDANAIAARCGLVELEYRVASFS